MDRREQFEAQYRKDSKSPAWRTEDALVKMADGTYLHERTRQMFAAFLAEPAARELTEEAQAEREAYERYHDEHGGCRCHLSPPCGDCTHPGNPLNQEEDDSCWQAVQE